MYLFYRGIHPNNCCCVPNNSGKINRAKYPINRAKYPFNRDLYPFNRGMYLFNRGENSQPPLQVTPSGHLVFGLKQSMEFPSVHIVRGASFEFNLLHQLHGAVRLRLRVHLQEAEV